MICFCSAYENAYLTTPCIKMILIFYFFFIKSFCFRNSFLGLVALVHTTKKLWKRLTGRTTIYKIKPFIISYVFSILLPGGAVFLDDSKCSKNLRNDCVQSSKFIYEIAEEMNNGGKYFPLWGTCLGYQLMLLHSFKGNSNDIRSECKKMECSLPIILENSQGEYIRKILVS